jgi:fructokinase
MKPVICFGEVLIDFQPVGGRPELQPHRFEQHAGGAPANVAVAVAALGGNAEFVGMLGADAFGDFLLESLRQAGVATTHVQRTSAAPTALAFVSLDAEGERSFSFYRQPAADLLFRECKLSARAFESAAVFHACSNSLTEEGIAQTALACLRRAREAGVIVSFEMNLRPPLWPHGVDPGPRIWNTLAMADVIKLSAEELTFLAAPLGSERAVLDALWAQHAAFVVVTDGPRPLRWYTEKAHGVMTPYRVRAIDSTAAGDAFTGALLHRLAERGINRQGLPAWAANAAHRDDALCFAAACGALATTRRGAFAAMPSRYEVEALMAATTPTPTLAMS